MCKKLSTLVRLFQGEDTSVQDKYMIGKAIVDIVEASMPKDEVLKLKEGTYLNSDCDRKLVISSTSKSSLDSRKIADELTVEELRLTYKASETSLKSIGKADLIAKYKSVETVKSAKVTKI